MGNVEGTWNVCGLIGYYFIQLIINSVEKFFFAQYSLLSHIRKFELIKLLTNSEKCIRNANNYTYSLKVKIKTV